MSTPSASAPQGEGDAAPASLDLRGTPCPLNFIRSRLALERIPSGSLLLVDLDRGDPERMVVDGLRQAGHAVVVDNLDDTAVRLQVRRDGAAAGPP